MPEVIVNGSVQLVDVETGTVTVNVDGGTVTVLTAGTQGPQGPAGPAGAAGQGVPTGGSTGQVLAKASGTNYDTAWVAAAAPGGSDTQVQFNSTGTFAGDSRLTWQPTGTAPGLHASFYYGDGRNLSATPAMGSDGTIQVATSGVQFQSA